MKDIFFASDAEEGFDAAIQEFEHPQTDWCGYDRSASISSGYYVCCCGFSNQRPEAFSIAALEAEVVALKEENLMLAAALTAYVEAQCRILDGWASGDQKARKYLWEALNDCERSGRAALASPKSVIDAPVV